MYALHCSTVSWNLGTPKLSWSNICAEAISFATMQMNMIHVICITCYVFSILWGLFQKGRLTRKRAELEFIKKYFFTYNIFHGLFFLTLLQELTELEQTMLLITTIVIGEYLLKCWIKMSCTNGFQVPSIPFIIFSFCIRWE